MKREAFATRHGESGGKSRGHGGGERAPPAGREGGALRKRKVAHRRARRNDSGRVERRPTRGGAGRERRGAGGRCRAGAVQGGNGTGRGRRGRDGASRQILLDGTKRLRTKKKKKTSPKEDAMARDGATKGTGAPHVRKTWRAPRAWEEGGGGCAPEKKEKKSPGGKQRGRTARREWRLRSKRGQQRGGDGCATRKPDKGARQRRRRENEQETFAAAPRGAREGDAWRGSGDRKREGRSLRRAPKVARVARRHP